MKLSNEQVIKKEPFELTRECCEEPTKAKWVMKLLCDEFVKVYAAVR